MIKNYFSIAVRHLLRHRAFSIINIVCLSIGITFSMLIGEYILNQERINLNLRNVNQQYFIKTKWKEKDLGLEITTVSPLAKAIKEEYPSLVANYYRYNPVNNVVSAGDKHFKEDISIGDTTFVSMYDFPLLYGDKHQAFINNNSAVITETMAMKLFEKKDAVGKAISIQTTVGGVSQNYIVSAVLKDIPYNSVTHLINSKYNVFVPTIGNHYYKNVDPSVDWNTADEISFIEVRNGVAVQNLMEPIRRTIKKYSADFIWKNLDIELAPVKDYHLKDNSGATQKMITILSLIAVFILLMVIINFVNISIGTSSYRLKEIGLRKVFGSARKQLIFQFLNEAIFLSVIAAIISVLSYQLLLPVFSQILNANLHPFWNFSFSEYAMLCLLILFIGFASGIYPAFVLSSSNLVNAVKGKIGVVKGGLSLKRSLLVVQFSLAIIVFICTLNLSRQVSFIFQKDLGYSKEQLLVITAFPKQWDSAGVIRMENIKQELLKVPAVKDASLTFDLPENKPNGRLILYPDQNKNENNKLNLPYTTADEDYAKTFGIKLLSGSFFHDDKSGIVLNETAVKQLGLDPKNAINKLVQLPIAGPGIPITGVVKDYIYSSMQDKIGPIGFIHISNNTIYRYLVVKLNGPQVSRAIGEIKSKWKSFSPAAPFEYEFMDEKFALLYKSELQLQKAAGIAAVLNLIIVLLGIIGVVAFTLTKRFKEIAVRKVLGANEVSIIILFLKEYASLILIANLIAWPLAYLISNHWLENFAYRIHQDIFSYVSVFVLVFVIAFGVIIIQCFKVAIANPVASLRSE